MPSQPSSPTMTGKAALSAAVPVPLAGLTLHPSALICAFVLHVEKTDPEMEAFVWPITHPPST